MSRPLRIEFNNAWYHIMNRGAGSRDIFLNNKERKMFLSLLSEITEIYSVEINSYCLMSNHYHLLVCTPLGNLSAAMRHLNSLYTRYFNKLEKRDGPLFRGRYKSKVISGIEYLLKVSRYIHLNPVRAKLVTNPEDYFWSSYKSYIKKTKQTKWLHTEKILGYFKKQSQQINYKKFVAEGLKQKDSQKIYGNKKTSPVIANAVAKNILNNIVNQTLHSKEIANLDQIQNQYELNNIANIVSQYYKINSNDIMRKKSHEFILYKSITMYLARYSCKYKLQEIAHFFGNITYHAVTKNITRLKKHMRNNNKINKDVILLQEKLRSITTIKSQV